MSPSAGDERPARSQKVFAAGGGDVREVIAVVRGAHPL